MSYFTLCYIGNLSARTIYTVKNGKYYRYFLKTKQTFISHLWSKIYLLETKRLNLPLLSVNNFQTHCIFSKSKIKYQGVKEFHMLARIGCYCNIMVFSTFKVKVTYYHPLNQWLMGATNGNQGQTVMHLQCSETINHI